MIIIILSQSDNHDHKGVDLGQSGRGSSIKEWLLTNSPTLPACLNKNRLMNIVRGNLRSVTLGFCNGLELRVIAPWVGKLINWLHVITCKKCDYIFTEKLPESKARDGTHKIHSSWPSGLSSLNFIFIF